MLRLFKFIERCTLAWHHFPSFERKVNVLSYFPSCHGDYQAFIETLRLTFFSSSYFSIRIPKTEK